MEGVGMVTGFERKLRYIHQQIWSNKKMEKCGRNSISSTVNKLATWLEKRKGARARSLTDNKQLYVGGLMH